MQPPQGERPQQRASKDAAEALINLLLSKKGKEIQPVIDTQHGCTYPEIERALKLNNAEANSLLERLTDEKLLRRRLVDRILVCPSCGSSNLAIRLFCPHCRSQWVRRRTLIEHFRCGFLGDEQNFKSEGELRCPKCQQALKRPNAEYRLIGGWFECESCQKRFDDPLMPLDCRNCSSKFSPNEAVLVDCFGYALDETAARERIKTISLYHPIAEALKGLGYAVETQTQVSGASGAPHAFDIVGSQGSEANRVFIDVASSSGEVGEQPVVAMFAKAFDVGNPQRTFLIAIPRISGVARKLASQYKLNVIEAQSVDEAVKILQERLTSL